MKRFISILLCLLMVIPLLVACQDTTDQNNPTAAEEEEEEVVEVEPTNNNRVVAVTYGDRNADTFEKTPYKTVILNYNSYAVRVTYNGTLYTVPSGGYVVINYND